MTPTGNDELDIKDLAIGIIRYFKRNFRIITICSLMGVSVGVVMWLLLPKVYASQMAVASDIVSEAYSDLASESLKNLINERNTSTLSKRLNLSVAEAGAISFIRIESLRKLTTDPEEPTIFEIRAEVLDRELIPKLQEGIVFFLRENDYVRRRVLLNEQKYAAMIKGGEKDLALLDSLKRGLINGRPTFIKNDKGMILDPSTIFTQSFDLTEKLYEAKKDLELVNAFQVIEGFTSFEKPTDPKLSVLVVIGFLLGFLSSIGTLTLIQLSKQASA